MAELDAVARLRFIADGAKQVEDAISRVREEGIDLDKSMDRLERDMSNLSRSAKDAAKGLDGAGSSAGSAGKSAAKGAEGFDAYSKAIGRAQDAQRAFSQKSVMAQFGADGIPAKAAEQMTVDERRRTLAAYEAQTVSVIGRLRQMEAAEKAVNAAVAKRLTDATSSQSRNYIISGTSGGSVAAQQKFLADYDAQVRALAEKSSPRLRYALYDVATTAGVMTTALTAAGAAVGVLAAQQESAFTNVERTLDGATTTQVQALRKELVGLTREIPLAFSNVAEIATLGNQLGIATDDVATFTQTVARFSAVTGVSAEESAQAFGSMGQILGVTASQYENLGSAIAYVARTSVATDAEILSLTREIGQQATAAGFTADQVVGLAGALGSLRVPPERSRGALTTYFQTLNQVVAEGGDKLDAFAAIVGRTADQLSADVAGGKGAAVFRDFALALSQMNTVDATRTLDELGLAQLRVADTFTRLSQNIEVYDSALSGASSSFRDGTELARQYALVLDDVASRWQIFINSVQEAGAAVGAVLAPAIGVALDILTKLMQGFADLANNPLGQGLIVTAAVIGTVVAALAGLVATSALALGSLSAIRTALVELGIVSVGATTGISGLIGGMFGLTTATGGAAFALKGLKLALVSTGVGAVVVLIGTLIAAFMDLQGAVTGTADFLEMMYNAVGKYAAPFRNLAGAIGGAAAVFDAYSGSAYTAAEITQSALDFMATVFAAAGSAIAGTIDGAIIWGNAIIDAVNQVVGAVGIPLSSLVQVFQTASNIIGQILAPIGQALETFGGGFTSGLAAFDGAVSNGFDSLRKWAKTLPGADSSLSGLGDTAASTANAFNGLSDSLGDSGGGAAEKIRTLTDYADDLRSVMSRAFDLRFGNQQGLDTITSAWSKIGSTIADARDEMAGYQAEMQGLSADRSLMEYWLTVAENYDDVLRAEKIRADLADMDKKQADTQKKLSAAQAKTNKTLEGNSDAAIANRAEIIGLVGNYQQYLTTLAANGMEQGELQATAAKLRAEFIQQATQMGYNRVEVDRYAQAFDDMGTVIRNIPRDVTVNFNGDAALTAIEEFKRRAQAALSAGGGLNVPIGTSSDNTGVVSNLRSVRDAYQAQLEALYTTLGGNSNVNTGRLEQAIRRINQQLSSMGYKSGGYTGDGGVGDIAGFVHGREYVMSAPAVRNAGGPRVMETFHNLLKSGKGFAPSGLAASSGVIQLSAYDRSLLEDIRDNIGLTIGAQTIQATVNGANGNAVSRRAG